MEFTELANEYGQIDDPIGYISIDPSGIIIATIISIITSHACTHQSIDHKRINNGKETFLMNRTHTHIFIHKKNKKAHGTWSTKRICVCAVRHKNVFAAAIWWHENKREKLELKSIYIYTCIRSPNAIYICPNGNNDNSNMYNCVYVDHNGILT